MLAESVLQSRFQVQRGRPSRQVAVAIQQRNWVSGAVERRGGPRVHDRERPRTLPMWLGGQMMRCDMHFQRCRSSRCRSSGGDSSTIHEKGGDFMTPQALREIVVKTKSAVDEDLDPAITGPDTVESWDSDLELMMNSASFAY